MENKKFIEILLGTYEEYLVGYKYYPKEQEIEQTIASHTHNSSIRCVAVHKNLLASGGADTRIFIYDLIKRKVHIVLEHHNSSINSLAFTPEHTHLLCGSADGVLSVVRVGNWQVEKIWEKAHKDDSAIIDIAMHPSGKLALTLASDHTLCTWNLVKGRRAYKIDLKSKSVDPKTLQNVLWAPDESTFALLGGKYTEFWDIKKGGLKTAVEHEHKVTCGLWLSDNLLLVGYANGKLGQVNLETEDLKYFDGHKIRIKAIAKQDDLIITASSDGIVKVWDEDFNNLAQTDSGCRITSLGVTNFNK